MFLQFCSESGLQQLVESPTRGDNVLDIILAKDDSVEDVNVSNAPITTDHLMITFTISPCPVPSSDPAMCWDYNKGDYEGLCINLAATDWTMFFSSCVDVNEMYNKFVEYMLFSLEIFVPRRNTMSSRLDSEVQRITHRLGGASEREGSVLQRKLQKLLHRKRIMEECGVVASQVPSAIHKYIQRRMKIKDSLSSIKREDGTSATGSLEKAEILRNVFAKTYPSQAELDVRDSQPALPTPPVSPNLQMVNDVDSSPENLERHLRCLANKRSSTPDGIPAFVYRKCGYDVCVPLSMILRRSLEDETVPDLFRCAIVCPVHKRGDKSDPKNKRPVSLTSVPCKLFEKVIAEQIYKNANSQGLISREQFAYRPGHSTVLQLLEAQNDWSLMLNNGVPFDCVYFDFKSAFETTTHSKLLKILPQYGVGPRLVNWVRAFLTARVFKVRVNDTLSSPAHVTSGCPQGTILGPLMYILYTDSLKYIIPQAVQVKIYADDVKMYTAVDNAKNMVSLQETLDKFLEWSNRLDLKLSINKCAVLHFGHNNSRHTYALGSEQLAVKASIKDLGILTTNTLSYTPHILEVVASASRRINWIMRSFVIKEPSLYVRLYKQYVLPVILYASPVWNTGLRRDRHTIVKMHKRFVKRVAFRCNVNVNEVQCEDIEALLKTNDIRAFKIVCRCPHRADRFFNFTNTNTRAGTNVQAKVVARKEIVNRMFAWRTARSLNNALPFA